MGSTFGDDDLLDFHDFDNDGDEADFFPSLPTQRNLTSQPTQAGDLSSSQRSSTSSCTPSKPSSVSVFSSNAPFSYIDQQTMAPPQPRAVSKRPERPKMKPLYGYEAPEEDDPLQPEWEIPRTYPNKSKNSEYESDLNPDSFSFDFNEEEYYKKHRKANPSGEDYRKPSSSSALPSGANSFRNISGQQQVLPRSSSNNSVFRQTQLDQFFPTRSSLGIPGSSGGSKRKVSEGEDDLYSDDNFEEFKYDDFSSQQRPVVPRQKIVKANPPPSSRSQHQFQSQGHSPFPSNLPNARRKHTSLVGEPYNSVFKFETFNKMQSESFYNVFETDDNIVISAPTAAGKTVLFDLAIIRMLQSSTSKPPLNLRDRRVGEMKVVYLAPIKALCSERVDDWNKRFGPLGVKCMELTSDTEEEFQVAANVDLIVTTPEKWDSATRKSKAYRQIVKSVKLILIDEVHHVGDVRGAALEAVVSRMKTGTATSSSRFIALSATCPNVEDIGEWLHAPPDCIKKFDESYRPVPLDVYVKGYNTGGKNAWVFNSTLNYKLVEVIREYSGGKPTLVFCSSRKETEASAQQLSRDLCASINRDHLRRLTAASDRAIHKTLKAALRYGIGFFHSALEPQDRRLVTDLMTEGDLYVVCSTSGLAMGVNLPARLVVIKGTMQAIGGKEMDILTIQQMIGRAGRPQFDNQATAVIMTEARNEYIYKGLLTGQKCIESNLSEHLNSEIVLETIIDVPQAIMWLKSTFFYIRILKNPAYYKIPAQLSSEQVEQKLKEICLNALAELHHHKLVEIDEDGYSVKSLTMGKTMAKYYIRFPTMKSLGEITNDSEVPQLLEIVSKAEEFSDIILRRSEKKMLNSANVDKEKMRYPLTGRIAKPEMKINVLIQSVLGGIEISDWSMNQETNTILSGATRVCKCMVAYAHEKNIFKPLQYSLLLAKSMNSRMWWDSPSVAKQLSKIGTSSSRILLDMHIDSFEKLAKIDPRRIEAMFNRHPPFGNEIAEQLRTVWTKFEIEFDQKQTLLDGGAELSLELRNVSPPRSLPTGKFRKGMFSTLIVGNERLGVLRYERINNYQSTPYQYTMTIPWSAKDEEVVAMLVNDDFAGMDARCCFSARFPGRKSVFVHSKSNSPIIDEVPSFSLGLEEHGYSTAQTRITPCKHTCKDKSTCKHPCCKSRALHEDCYYQPQQQQKEEKKERKSDDLSLLRSKARDIPSTPARRIATEVVPAKSRSFYFSPPSSTNFSSPRTPSTIKSSSVTSWSSAQGISTSTTSGVALIDYGDDFGDDDASLSSNDNKTEHQVCPSSSSSSHAPFQSCSSTPSKMSNSFSSGSSSSSSGSSCSYLPSSAPYSSGFCNNSNPSSNSSSYSRTAPRSGSSSRVYNTPSAIQISRQSPPPPPKKTSSVPRQTQRAEFTSNYNSSVVIPQSPPQSPSHELPRNPNNHINTRMMTAQHPIRSSLQNRAPSSINTSVSTNTSTNARPNVQFTMTNGQRVEMTPQRLQELQAKFAHLRKK